jgi:S1-C subfamily serine protease
MDSDGEDMGGDPDPAWRSPAQQRGAPEVDPARRPGGRGRRGVRGRPWSTSPPSRWSAASPIPADPFFEESFRNFVDPRPRPSTRTSLGSGVIIRGDGTILTNEHVILRGGRIHVTLADGGEFEAKLVGRDPDADLAVLRIDAGRALPYIALGSSDDLMIGETVIAIGNPFPVAHRDHGRGERHQAHAPDRGRTYTDFIQTDASINPGTRRSGLNILGQLIGINTASTVTRRASASRSPRTGRGDHDSLWPGGTARADPNQLAWDQLGVEARDGDGGLAVTRVRGGSAASGSARALSPARPDGVALTRSYAGDGCAARGSPRRAVDRARRVPLRRRDAAHAQQGLAAVRRARRRGGGARAPRPTRCRARRQCRRSRRPARRRRRRARSA